MRGEKDFITRVITVLESMSISYMIGGGFALAVWATPRVTHDLDIVVDLPAERIPEFCAHFSEERYYIVPEAMQEAFERRDQPGLGMYSFLDVDAGFKADLFPLRSNDPAQHSAFGRRVAADVLGGLRADVCAPDDLLVQKLRWYAMSQSEIQFRDCLNLVLTDLQQPTRLISWDYVENWVMQLGPEVERAWEAVKGAANAAG